MTDIEIPADLDAAIAEAEAKAARLEAEAHDIHAKAGDRALKPGEQTRFDRLTAGARAAQAEAHEFRVEKRRRSIADIEAQMATGNVRRLPGAPDFTPITTRGDAPHRYVEERGGFASLAPADRVACARAALEVSGVNERMVTAFDHGLADRDSRPFADPARALTIAKSDPVYRDAFVKRIAATQRGIPGEYTREELAVLHRVAEARDALGIGNDGSTLVPTAIDATWATTGSGAGPDRLLDIADRRVIAASTYKGVKAAQVAASWDDEGEEVSDDTPAPSAVSIPLHSARAWITASWELQQDAPMLVEEVQAALDDGLDVLIDTALGSGSGTGEPKGFITALDGTASEDTSPNTAEDFTLADAYDLVAALPSRHHRGARWVAHIGTGLDIRQQLIGSSSGAGTWVDHGPAVGSSFLGYPVTYNDAAPSSLAINAAATATNTCVLTLGRFGDRFRVVTHVAGTSVSYVPHLMGTTNQRPLAQSGWLAFTRLGADVVDVDSFRAISVPTTA